MGHGLLNLPLNFVAASSISTTMSSGLLYRACHGHTHERNHPDVTIQTCWDSDRLDLGRVGITPHPSRLCTEVAKTTRNDQVGRWSGELRCHSKFCIG